MTLGASPAAGRRRLAGRVPPGALSISAWNLVSRGTGFVRVLAVGAALGATFAGNTYQSANLVSNILFELLAAGVLSSVLVPAFVARLEEGGREDAAALAGAVLGVVLAVLAVVCAAGLALRPAIMRALTLAVDDPGVRDAQVRLGSFLLWFLLPQVVLYGAGAVATGLLHAAGRFAATAAAPVLNNAVVVATMAAFWAAGDGGPPGLDLSLGWRVLLGAGTTAGVAAMCALPVAAAWRAGLRLRPRWAPGDPRLRRLARGGAWAAGYLASGQVLVATTLVLANRVEGGAVATQIAYTFFLLPHALLAHPVLTAAYPRLAADAARGDGAAFARRLGESVALVAGLTAAASAVLALVARPLLDLVAVGALGDAGGDLVAPVLVAYAVGLAGYSSFMLLTRAAYAAGDTRTPTVVHAVAAAAGAALMVAWSGAAEGTGRVTALGWAHSLAMLGAAAALGLVLARRRQVAVAA